MKKAISFFVACLLLAGGLKAQAEFEYTVSLTPVDVSEFPGLHSFAFGQHNGKWLLIGGRRDGLHARQPFASFPADFNNTDIFVIDIATLQTWTASVSQLPASIAEQLQATNMNFFQAADTLYIIGGYAYSASAGDHITFPKLTAVMVPGLIDAIINQESIQPFFRQIENDIFAVTGGQLGKIGNTFYLVGGHRFDGRYNPMNNPTFEQEYTNQIRKFTIDNSQKQLSFGNYETITDEVHLRRRDYNLLPMVFEDGTPGYAVSSGVFQINFDLPFLYPVEIRPDGYTPVTDFNQYLSNYHGAKVSLFDSDQNSMHALFFGGISQFFFEDDIFYQDDLVPFVKTISRLTREADGTWHEFKLPVEMPFLQGASAEFIPNKNLPHFDHEAIKLSQISSDTIILGHVVGGIFSPEPNPFSFNQTHLTEADYSIFEVKLIKVPETTEVGINGINPYEVEVFPNPAKDQVRIRYHLRNAKPTEYFITTLDGRLLDKGIFRNQTQGENVQTLSLPPEPGLVLLTLVFENRFFVTKQIIKH
ncbi:MAG: T9SS type A sorting domain-containing protein [Bacteroidales bacterium]|nr:T9SS type A sorting domain-containing protein [Bacteroidales bacterium]